MSDLIGQPLDAFDTPQLLVALDVGVIAAAWPIEASGRYDEPSPEPFR